MPSLKFNLAKNSASKIADFKDEDTFKQYVAAEEVDPFCKEIYFQYQAARTLPERHQLAAKLDSVRWEFYKKWRAKGNKAESSPTLPTSPKVA